MSSPSVTAFRAWWNRIYNNGQPTATEEACFQAGVEWSLGVVGQTNREGSDLRGRVITLFRPLTSEEVKLETGYEGPADLTILEAEIAASQAAKDTAVYNQDFELAAKLRSEIDRMQKKRDVQVRHKDLDGSWACLELDDGTLIYGALGMPFFTGYKPSAPEGQRKVGFTFQTAVATIATAPQEPT